MSSPSPRYRRLFHRLLYRIVLVASLCMLLMGGAQMYLAYQQAQHDIRHTVQIVGENSQHLLATALWDIEVAAVQQQVDWLQRLPEVAWVRVRSSTGQVFAAGEVEDADANPSIRVFDILATTNGSKLGTLELAPDQAFFAARIGRTLLAVVSGYLVFTLLICLSVSWVLRRDLERPLQQIARFAAALKPNELAQPLVLDHRRGGAGGDEIDLVVDGFNGLQNELRRHIEALDETVAERTRQLSAAVEEIRQMSHLDALTGCYNRRMFDARLPAEMERSCRYGRPLSLIFVDIDHFKAINDAHGHGAGDQVLRVVAGRLLESVRRQIDWVVRYGGEEFIVVLPERSSVDGALLAERLRVLIESTPVALNGKSIAVSASFGVAEYRHTDGTDELLGRADEALYRAKDQGRNRVEVADQILIDDFDPVI